MNSDRSGFTLIEVLIAMFILVVISFSTFQATTETFKLRDVISAEGEFYNGVRLAMSVLQRDLENAYSPVAIRPEASPTPAPGTPEAATGMPQTQQPDLVQSIYFHSEVDRNGIRPMKLEGNDSRLTWVGAGNLRVYRDSAESEFLKLRYVLENDTDPDAPSGSKMLVRIASPDAFVYNEDQDKRVRKYPLLHGIRKWQFRYYSKEKDQWSSSWDSESADTKELFPDIIEVTLEAAAPKGLSFEGLYKIRPEVPLHGVPATL